MTQDSGKSFFIPGKLYRNIESGNIAMFVMHDPTFHGTWCTVRPLKFLYNNVIIEHRSDRTYMALAKDYVRIQ